ncbi:MAG: DASS family sodium-coupled anion symporter [Acidobacteria bacterium]|nr:DASS family sodium-coupled anion symporter [Acidobacteriota bacterium]
MSWKDLAEMAPKLSEAEIRFEKKRRLAGLVLGPLLFVIVLLSPPLEHVTPVGMRTLGIFLWIVTWWISEAIPIPVTALFSMALLVVCGILPAQEAFNYWANWINIFLIGAFIIGHATSIHGLTRRLAYRMIASPLLAGDPWRLLVLFGVGPALFSALISNVVSTMIFLSIALGLMETLQFPQEGRYGEALCLAIAWGAAMGGIITPVGSPPNLIIIGLMEPLGYHIGFAQWTAVCLPVAVAGLAAMFFVIRYILRPQTTGWQVSPEMLRQELEKLGPMSRGEKIAGGALLTAVFLWVLPDMARIFLGREHDFSVWLAGHLGWEVSAILVATALFLIPVDWEKRKFAMTWPEAVKGIEWGTLSLIGGALALGSMLAHRTLGLGEFFAQSISSLAASGTSQFVFVLGGIVFTVLLTNLASNVAISSMVGALALAVLPSTGLNPLALMVPIALASSMAFSLPMATPPNAIVFASGQVRITNMFKSGSVLSLICVVILSLFGFILVEWIFPQGG